MLVVMTEAMRDTARVLSPKSVALEASIRPIFSRPPIMPPTSGAARIKPIISTTPTIMIIAWIKSESVLAI